MVYARLRQTHQNDEHGPLDPLVATYRGNWFYLAPPTHQAALTLLGQTLRRIHALPVATDAPRRDARDLLKQLWEGLRAGFALPEFVGQAVGRVLDEAEPASESSQVLCHNDINPSNLVYDGERLVVLDWAAAGPNDPFYDLATPAVFMRMSESDCLSLLSAYDGTPVATLPPRFLYRRRVVATLSGVMQLHLARQMKHPGVVEGEAVGSVLALGECYQRMRSGELQLGTADGHWAFGLALLKEGLNL